MWVFNCAVSLSLLSSESKTQGRDRHTEGVMCVFPIVCLASYGVSFTSRHVLSLCPVPVAILRRSVFRTMKSRPSTLRSPGPLVVGAVCDGPRMCVYVCDLCASVPVSSGATDHRLTNGLRQATLSCRRTIGWPGPVICLRGQRWRMR